MSRLCLIRRSVWLGFLDRPVSRQAVLVWRSLQQGSRAVVPPLWLLDMANGFATGGAQRRPHEV